MQGYDLPTKTSKSLLRLVSVATTRAASCSPPHSQSLSQESTRRRPQSWLRRHTKSAPIPMLFGATSTLASPFRLVRITPGPVFIPDIAEGNVARNAQRTITSRLNKIELARPFQTARQQNLLRCGVAGIAN